MADLVSILIPVYNAEKWLGDTIKSALNQTWPKKEIIIVDDGSKDDTLQVARQFGSKIVKVITQENRGASAARNKALSYAQGDYIQWLDADDLLAPDKISQQLRFNESDKNSRMLLSSAFGKFYFRHKKAKFIPHSLWQDLDPVEWLLRRFNENVWMTNSSWLVSRRLTELTGHWNERLSFNDDGEYFCRVVSLSEKIKFFQEARSYYRQCNIRSFSRNTSYHACKSLLLSMSLSINYLRTLEDSERTRSACLKYLQRWLYHFYPEKTGFHREKDKILLELLYKINYIARELGGTLLLPELNWKYVLFRRIFGRKIAMKVRNLASTTNLLVHKNWDRLLYTLFN